MTSLRQKLSTLPGLRAVVLRIEAIKVGDESLLAKTRPGERNSSLNRCREINKGCVFTETVIQSGVSMPIGAARTNAARDHHGDPINTSPTLFNTRGSSWPRRSTKRNARDIETKSSHASAGGRVGTGEIGSLTQLNLRHELPAPQKQTETATSSFRQAASRVEKRCDWLFCPIAFE